MKPLKARIAAALVSAAALVGGAAATAAPASASASAARVVVYGVPLGRDGSNIIHPKVRPTGLLEWAADGSHYFIIHTWRTWSPAGASGSATVHFRSCWGSCMRYKTAPVTLRFYRVLRHGGTRYFTRLHFTLAHKVKGIRSGTLRFSPVVCRHGTSASSPGSACSSA
jgi:hypothetical protein